jgi:uncharacterized protein (TIGR02646 family)
MIPITKTNAPPLLNKYIKNSLNVSYKQLSEEKEFKDVFYALRLHLLSEQKYLCCYCQQKIENVLNPNGVPLMGVDHFLPKDKTKYLHLQLEYRNLLAACLGNKDSKKKPNHCDASKGNEELLFLKNPASNDFLDVFDYQILPASKEVRIVPSAPYKDNNNLRTDIDKILNLNEQSLRSRRFTVWQRAMEKIGFDIKKTIEPNQKTMRLLRNLLEDYALEQNKSKFNEFAGFIFKWLNQRFRDELRNQKN